MPLDSFRKILDLLVIVFLHELSKRLEEIHVVVEEGLGAEHFLQEVSIHGLFMRILSKHKHGGILEGNGEVIVIFVAREVMLEAYVDIFVKRRIFPLELFRKKFKSLAHAVLRHLLLRLLQFFELPQQNFVYFT